MALSISEHPCFNETVRAKFGRIHLPVAPHCNMQCRFCNRLYDCVNESRPGVTSAVLRPADAMRWLSYAIERDTTIRVVGIAGPGDPFANPDETLTTLRLVRERYPKMLLCIATNGMALAEYVDELAKLEVSHVTVTVNAVNPAVGARIYRWMRDKTRVLRGLEAAQRLLENQRRGIERLKEFGILVKINSIIIPGVNVHHIPEIARAMSELRADIFNALPLYPVEGAEFAALGEPDPETVATLRKECAAFIPQMRHCARCRADAAGLLNARGDALSLETFQSACKSSPDPSRPYVAVASQEGVLVNVHLGNALDLLIFENGPQGPSCIARRPAPLPGGGETRWESLADTLGDCRAVLVSAAGKRPCEILHRRGIDVITMDGLIAPALQEFFTGGSIPAYMTQSVSRDCNSGCGGGGSGCCG